jgi:hypothetical protein
VSNVGNGILLPGAPPAQSRWSLYVTISAVRPGKTPLRQKGAPDCHQARLLPMPLLLRVSLPFVFAGVLAAQYPGLTLPPSGNNQKASVVQYVGPVRIAIDYSSPAVHTANGQDRRGQIWGKLVPYGLTNLGFGNGKPGPWRAGANENTVFAVSSAVSIEGKPLPAGRYGLHMIPGESEWTIIFSKDAGAWGSFFYEDSHDALRVTVKPHKHDYREWLTYEFTTRKPTEATAEMQWEDLTVGWAVKVEDPGSIYLSHLSSELTSVPGFSDAAYNAAAQYTVQENAGLEQGLKWADASISMPSVGRPTFANFSTKAQILSKLGKDDEAKTLMQTALHTPGTTVLDIHQYGRQLLAAKKVDEAVAVFKYNAEKFGNVWPVHVGLARAYSAKGDNQKALEEAKLALPQAPDNLNKSSLEAMIKTLSEGKSIN